MFNASAVGAGSARQKYEKLLHTFLRKAFEVFNSFWFFLSGLMYLYEANLAYATRFPLCSGAGTSCGQSVLTRFLDKCDA